MSPRLLSAVSRRARCLRQRVFAERLEEPLPREWIAFALVGSIVAFVWGWLLGGSAFLQNVLAALALLGPGLLLTNVIAVRLRVQRRSADQKSRIAATVATLTSDAFMFWPPVFNVFDQLGMYWWAEDWRPMRDGLLEARDKEPATALAWLGEIMRETSRAVERLTMDSEPDELMNIGDTPRPTELLSRWRSLFAVLNQDVPVPATLAQLETSMTELQATRIEVHAK